MPNSSARDVEIAQLEREICAANGILRWAPWLGLTMLAAIPLGNAYGQLVGWGAFVTAASCTGILVYMPIMRRQEYRQRVEELREQES